MKNLSVGYYFGTLKAGEKEDLKRICGKIGPQSHLEVGGCLYTYSTFLNFGARSYLFLIVMKAEDSVYLGSAPNDKIGRAHF